MIMGTQPQASWSLKTDHINPCDTSLIISQSEICAQANLVPETLSPHLAFKNALLKPFEELGFLEHEPPCRLYNKLFFGPNSDASVCLILQCVGHMNLH